jgi:hypothetical protein
VKKMLALATLVAAPLAAQSIELGLNISRQTYQDQSAVLGSLKSDYKLDDKTVIAARFGYALVDIGPALFQLTAAYQPSTETNATVNVSLANVPFAKGTGTYKQGYWGAGAALTFKALFAVGVGLEYRSEKLEGAIGSLNSSTTYGRPWARANVGYAFPSPIVKPFIGLEVAAPLAKKDLDANTTSSDDFLKALAPKMTVGLYGGIRF